MRLIIRLPEIDMRRRQLTIFSACIHPRSAHSASRDQDIDRIMEIGVNELTRRETRYRWVIHISAVPHLDHQLVSEL
jgi:hypothetical protein